MILARAGRARRICSRAGTVLTNGHCAAAPGGATRGVGRGVRARPPDRGRGAVAEDGRRVSALRAGAP
jgi:hypothetical protein